MILLLLLAAAKIDKAAAIVKTRSAAVPAEDDGDAAKIDKAGTVVKQACAADDSCQSSLRFSLILEPAGFSSGSSTMTAHRVPIRLDLHRCEEMLIRLCD